MSDSHSGDRHVDPLAALRATDRRPLTEVWRERLRCAVDDASVRRAGRGLAAVFGVIVAAGVGWKLYATSAPPVEASLPFASATTTPVASQVDTASTAASDPSPDAGALGAVVFEDSPAPVVVHVAGAVAKPGLVVGQTGWRVDDAIRGAGGALGPADLDRLNLAALVVDGERIFVPAVGEEVPPVLASERSAGVDRQVPIVVDLNTADLIELQSLPGIGPATASTIVEHREVHGGFASVDALVAVRGIGPATLEALRDHVRAG